MSDIRLEGVDEILNAMSDMANEEDIKRTLGRACALVERSAKEKAPKGSGDLRRYIESRVEGATGIVVCPLEYAPYVEYGTGLFAENNNGRKDVPWCYKDEKTGEFVYTKGQHPHPFMRPALYENREEILRILKEGIGND